MKKVLGIILIILIGIFGFMFFKSEEKQEKEIKEYITIAHTLGETKVAKNPERVVVFDFGMLDVMDTLGANVVGVAKDGIPAHLKKYEDEKYENVGSLKEPNIEKIYNLKPDLIMISSRQRDFYEQLSKVAPTIYFDTYAGDYLSGLKTNVGMVSDIFDNSEILQERLNKIEERVNSIETEVKNKGLNAIITLSSNGKISTYGEESRFGIIFRNLGFASTGEAIAGSHGNKVTFEYLLEKNPDYIFVVDKSVVTGSDVLANKAFDNPIIKSTKAYTNGNIVFLDAVVWYTAAGGLVSTEIMLDNVEKSLK